jgi:hypothetical protein
MDISNLNRLAKKTVGAGVTLMFALFVLMLPSRSFAAVLSIDPEIAEFGPGDTFISTIRIDTEEGECINAVRAELKFPGDWIRVSTVSKGESLFTLWTEEPKADNANGVLTLEGGIPAGYCGRVEGDPGKTNIVAKIIFTIPGNMIGGKTTDEELPLSIEFGSSTTIYQNDGLGTPATMELKGANYTRLLQSSGLTNEWTDLIDEDDLLPELFTVELEQDPNTFQGKYFIVFSTVDKQSGIHHYEVMEDDPNRFGYVRGGDNKALFKEVTSPYLLEDQELGSRIVVRAYDHAGNFQESLLGPQSATYGFSEKKDQGGFGAIQAVMVVGTLIVAATLLWWFLIRKKLNAPHDNNNETH